MSKIRPRLNREEQQFEDKTLPKREFKKGFIVRFAHEEDKKHLMYLNEKTFNLSFDITNKL